MAPGKAPHGAILHKHPSMARQEGYTVPDTHVLVQAVFVHDLNRLSRKLAHQLLLSDEFEQAGVALRIVTMPDGAKTPETQLLSNVRGIITSTRARLPNARRT